MRAAQRQAAWPAHLGDARNVLVDLRVGEHLPCRVAPGWIADLRRAAADEHDGLVAALLKMAQDHNLQQAADVQAAGGGVKAEIGGHDLLAHQRVEFREVRALVQIAA